MANEYSVNQADLTAVADAIRAKAESSEALSFPSGFVDAIANLGGGLPSNISAIASGTFVTTDSPKSLTIEHGLGTSPNFLIITVQEAIEPASYDNKIVYQFKTQQNIRGFEGIGATRARYSDYQYTHKRGTVLVKNTTTFTAGGDDTYYFMNGYVYHWVCGVIDNVEVGI